MNKSTALIAGLVVFFLAGIAGYFAAMLYNQNNVAAEASPVTTLLEIQVGQDFCDCGFVVGDEPGLLAGTWRMIVQPAC